MRTYRRAAIIARKRIRRWAKYERKIALMQKLNIPHY